MGSKPKAPPKPPPPPPVPTMADADGVFHEGWSEGLKSAGYERLANKAMLAKDEATFFKSLDDSLAFLGRKNAGGYHHLLHARQ